MKIYEKQGNIFSLENYSLVHCISADYAMGAGIALTFTKEYPNLKQAVKEIVDRNGTKAPDVIGYFVSPEVFIFNLVTKDKYFQKPSYASLRDTLIILKGMCEMLHIERIAMPKIGCGLDRLSWDLVQELIEDVFKFTEIEIQVRYL